MDTLTLRHLLKQVVCPCRTKKTYVLAQNQLELVDWTATPLCLIVNTSPIQVRNGHWISVYVTSNKIRTICYVSDSFASMHLYNIKLPEEFVIVDNSQPLQDDYSTVCGLYALFFLHLLSKGYSSSYYYSLFSKNKKRNDRKVLKFYKALKTNIKKSSDGQICCSKAAYFKNNGCR